MAETEPEGYTRPIPVRRWPSIRHKVLTICRCWLDWSGIVGLDDMKISCFVAGFVVACAGFAVPAEAMTLQPDKLPGMCLSMTGREGQAESRECDGSPDQEIELPGREGGPIRHAGKCLAPRGQGLYPELYAVACDRSTAQTWTLPASGEVRNGEGRCLALLGLSSRSGERLYAGECPERVAPQSWRQVDATQQTYRNMTGRFELVGREGQCLAWIDAGNFLGLAPCADVSGQRFSFNAAQHGQYRIKSSCLSAGFLDGGMNIGDCGSGRESLWLHRTDQTLVNGLGLCATAENQNGRDVIRSRACQPQAAQQWRFVAATRAATLQHERLPGMCVSMSAPEGASESRPCDGSVTQAFSFSGVMGASGGPIRHHGKCLAPRGEGYYPELFAEICDGSPAQTWRFMAEGALRNGDDRCLSVLGVTSESGAMVYGGECDQNVEALRWRVVNVTAELLQPVTGAFESQAHPGHCIAYDAWFGLATCAYDDEQVFSFDRAGSGPLRLLGSCLGGGFAFETIALTDCVNTPSQAWRLTADGHIVNASGACVEVGEQNGQRVLLERACREGLPAQCWIFQEQTG